MPTKPTAPPKPRRSASTTPRVAARTEDHRARTGAIRREQTRRKLLAAAMAVFAEKGADAPLIDDFIAAAGVARGTFYNYFNTTQELLSAVTSDLSDQVIASIEEVVERIPDPLERMATACLIYMHAGIAVPNWGAFLTRTGSRSEALGKLVDVYLPRDLELARKAGEVDYPAVRAARDLVIASINQAIQTMYSGSAAQSHSRQVLFLILRGIGVRVARAQKLSQLPLPVVSFPEWLAVGR